MSHDSESHLMQDQSGILQRKYPDLQQSFPVERAVEDYEHRERNPVPNNPEARISLYIQRLEQQHSIFQPKSQNPVYEHLRQKARDRFAASFAIKAENIPDSYFANQQRLAKERGYGNVEFDPEARAEMADSIRKDQIVSLAKWIDYMRSPEVEYPAWFKYFTLRNVVQMSGFDKEKQAFRQRSVGTTAPFPDLNREALAYVYDHLSQQLRGQKVKDAQLQQLLQGASFPKLYAYSITQSEAKKSEEHKEIIGSWRKFGQGSDAKLLSGSLEGYGTGWCTAGESTAKMQLADGDFYVYYSRNDQGQEVIPRVAIRMENGQVAEIRRINKDQELEPELIDIALDQAKMLPGGDKYFKKADDMKRLTRIYQLQEKGQPLTTQDLQFLYETTSTIEGFGYETDPRIEEIKQERDILQDLAKAYGLESHQILVNNQSGKISIPPEAKLWLTNKVPVTTLFDLQTGEQLYPNLKYVYPFERDRVDVDYQMDIKRNEINPIIADKMLKLMPKKIALDWIANNCDHFVKLSPEIAEQMVNQGKLIYFVLETLHKFPDLDLVAFTHKHAPGKLLSFTSYISEMPQVMREVIISIGKDSANPDVLADLAPYLNNINQSVAEHELEVNLHQFDKRLIKNIDHYNIQDPLHLLKVAFREGTRVSFLDQFLEKFKLPDDQILEFFQYVKDQQPPEEAIIKIQEVCYRHGYLVSR